jgi:hypothetical protein
MKWIKRTFKFLGILILILFIVAIGVYLAYNEPLPKGKEDTRAIELVQKIQAAINQPAWDSTHYVEWSFFGVHHFVWDKKRHLVKVSWDEYDVLLNPNTITGIVYENGIEITDQSINSSIIETANQYFINDAFWLNAPAQIAGDDRKLETVTLEDGSEGLLVTYLSGGVTPGDSYLWILDDKGLPKAWKMWVGILPIGGIETSWEKWVTLPTGAKIATIHDGGIASVPITNLKSYQTQEAGQWERDIFEALSER